MSSTTMSAAAADGALTSEIESSAGEAERALSASERARIERNRLRARALRDARLHLQTAPVTSLAAALAAPTDSGGGFLLCAEEESARPVRAAAPPAPLPEPERPPCEECGRPVATSYLLDAFDCAVCDACRDEEGAHALLTRTEAKTEFLLKDCDLDARSPALRCVRRPNPHRFARSDMRLYLRAQVERRALDVWGSEARLEAERAARDDRRGLTQRRKESRRLRALRMDVRSSLYKHERAAHAHRWGAERHDAQEDSYSRDCLDCGHTETYEKM